MGFTTVELPRVDGNQLLVNGLDAMNRMFTVDIKSYTLIRE